VTLRAAEPGDAEAVAEIFLAARAEMTYLPELHTAAETHCWVRDVLLPDHEVWIAEEDGGLAGFAALGDDFLEHIYVRPEAQGRGLGTALLELSKQRRPKRLRLWVFQKNAGARRLYERHGFELVGSTDGAGNEEHEPDALYEWRPAVGARSSARAAG
jgi:GNAT superfamily N-acetyltransferase